MPKSSIKVLYASFDRVPQPKGAGVHIAQFVRSLASKYDVTLFTPGPEPACGEICGAKHIVAECRGDNYLAEALAFRNAVDNHIENNEYRIIHFRGIWEGMPAVKRKIEKKRIAVFEVNGLPSIELKYHFPAVGRNAEFISRLCSAEAEILIESDVIIVPSNVTKSYLESRGIASWKIHTIHNGVDTDLFTPSSSEPDGIPTIIYIGTLAPWQGLSHLLEAFRAVLKSHEARLRIVGKHRKEWLNDLRKQSRKLKIAEAVEFVGPIKHSEMPGILHSAHIGVAPFLATERNTKQGFCPIKVLEYMASGLPTAAPEIDSVKELIGHEQEGLLYKPNSMARLRDSLIELITEKAQRRKLGANARKRVEQYFTWSIAGGKILHLYDTLIKC